MKLRFYLFSLRFRYPFTIATGTRATTEVAYVELKHDGLIGYGEAAMPPYVGENQESVMRFFSTLNLAQFNTPLDTDAILDYCDTVAPGNHAAKAAIDIALHDLVGKILGKPLYQLLNIEKEKTPFTCITIGMDTTEAVKKKVSEAAAFKIFKVKLGGDNDRQSIETIRVISDKPLMADANQGWRDKHAALEMIVWLKEQGVVLIEQPFPKEWKEETAWLSERSPLPIIADEAIQRLSDLEQITGVYHGINIKLMKCSGLREARKMIERARALNLKILLGCMSESSCAVTAAAHLSPLVDWADLDGPSLITNDPFTGMQVVDGKIALNDLPGIGATPNELFPTML